MVQGLRDGEKGMATAGVMQQSCVRWQTLVLSGLDSIRPPSPDLPLSWQVTAALACLPLLQPVLLCWAIPGDLEMLWAQES